MTAGTTEAAAPARVEVDTLAAQIECIRREISFRERVYPRWVKQGKLTQQNADLEMARMRAVLATLEGLLLKPTRVVTDDMVAAKREGAETVLRMIPSSLAVRIHGAVYRKLGV